MMGNLVMFRKDSVLNILSKGPGFIGIWERKGASALCFFSTVTGKRFWGWEIMG
jgi:hypothetical protein